MNLIKFDSIELKAIASIKLNNSIEATKLNQTQFTSI